MGDERRMKEVERGELNAPEGNTLNWSNFVGRKRLANTQSSRLWEEGWWGWIGLRHRSETFSYWLHTVYLCTLVLEQKLSYNYTVQNIHTIDYGYYLYYCTSESNYTLMFFSSFFLNRAWPIYSSRLKGSTCQPQNHSQLRLTKPPHS